LSRNSQEFLANVAQHSSPSRPRRVLLYTILRSVPSTSTHSAGQLLLGCAPERVAAPREVHVNTLDEERPQMGGAEVLQGAPSRGRWDKKCF
jgi:hypothetical protein